MDAIELSRLVGAHTHNTIVLKVKRQNTLADQEECTSTVILLNPLPLHLVKQLGVEYGVKL